MKTERARVRLIVAALILIAQIALVAPMLVAAQNANTSTTAREKQNGTVGIPYNRACRTRCLRAYRTCLRRNKNTQACRVRLRDCLRRCPQ
jgi:hypothetical protein